MAEIKLNVVQPKASPPVPRSGITMTTPAASTTRDFRVKGLCCVEEVSILQRELGRLDGVIDLSFDVLNARMRVISQPTLGSEVVVAAVAKTGMTAEPWTIPRGDTPKVKDSSEVRRQMLTIVSGGLIGAGMILHGLTAGWLVALDFQPATVPVPWWVNVCYLGSAMTGGWFVYPKAWISLRRFRPDMNLLMVVAIIGAILLGKYIEAASVAFLFALSLLLESWSVNRARHAVESLLSLAPMQARIICPKDGDEEMVAVEQVSPGTTIIVKPGEKFPLDGKITKGIVMALALIVMLVPPLVGVGTFVHWFYSGLVLLVIA